MGHVFDVSKGAEFYAPGNGYDFFTFRDGSRAFVTGTFTEVSQQPPSTKQPIVPTPTDVRYFVYVYSHTHLHGHAPRHATPQEGLTDDLAGLSPGECQAVLRWLRFFQDKADYPYVGRLAGTFFAPGTGELTPAYLRFRECAYRSVVERCVEE